MASCRARLGRRRIDCPAVVWSPTKDRWQPAALNSASASADQVPMSTKGGSQEMPQGSQRPASAVMQRLENLLGQLQGHSSDIHDLWQAGEAAQLKLLAGQLKDLTCESDLRLIREMADELDSLLLGEEAEASALCEKIEALIHLCRTVK